MTAELKSPFYLSAFDRKIVIADIRNLKRQQQHQQQLQQHRKKRLNHDRVIQKLIKKYCDLAAYGALCNKLTITQANNDIMAYKQEIPEIFRQEFENHHHE